jgi:hypothetical protein
VWLPEVAEWCKLHRVVGLKGSSLAVASVPQLVARRPAMPTSMEPLEDVWDKWQDPTVDGELADNVMGSPLLTVPTPSRRSAAGRSSGASHTVT